MICTDCNGTGKYAPLFGPLENCIRCKGTGQVQAGELLVPADVAGDDTILTENLTLGSSNQRRDKYVWLAQRWDASQHGLVAGAYYMHEPGCTPTRIIPPGSHKPNQFGMDIDHRTLEVYRLEFPSRGFKMHLPGDVDYDKMRSDYGSNPCVERGVLFIGFNACVGCQVEFFASEDTMGINFVTQMSSYRQVELGSVFEQAAAIYLPTIITGRP